MSMSEQSPALLSVRDLTVAYQVRGQSRPVVREVSFEVLDGQFVSIVGESGSGKSTTILSVLGLLPENARVLGGEILFRGQNLLEFSERELQRVRGGAIGFVPQDPTVSLNPVQTIGQQVSEALRVKRGIRRREVEQIVHEVLAAVGIPDPERRAGQYPHQLSGGLRQRVLIAIATIERPALIVADEATSALDVTLQKRVLDLLDSFRHDTGAAVLLVTHDISVALERSARVLVFRDGLLEEAATPLDLLHSSRTQHARELISIAQDQTRRVRPPASTQSAQPLLRVEAITKSFADGSRRAAPVTAVDEVGFTLDRGRTLALIGESGSGKTTTARLLLLIEKPDSGRIVFDGQDITDLAKEERRLLRQRIQFVQQNPYSSLEPRFTVHKILEEPLRNLTNYSERERTARVEKAIEDVQLSREYLDRHPAELSGGQRQRVAIARAIILEPELLILDEAVSALDVSVQARILELLLELQERLGLTYLFISHDLSVVRRIADDVVVMHRGRIVEQGTIAELFEHPRESYTRTLINSIPAIPRVVPTFDAVAERS